MMQASNELLLVGIDPSAQGQSFGLPMTLSTINELGVGINGSRHLLDYQAVSFKVGLTLGWVGAQVKPMYSVVEVKIMT